MSGDEFMWVWDTPSECGVSRDQATAEKRLVDALGAIGPGAAGTLRTVVLASSVDGATCYRTLDERRMTVDERGVVEWTSP